MFDTWLKRVVAFVAILGIINYIYDGYVYFVKPQRISDALVVASEINKFRLKTVQGKWHSFLLDVINLDLDDESQVNRLYARATNISVAFEKNSSNGGSIGLRQANMQDQLGRLKTQYAESKEILSLIDSVDNTFLILSNWSGVFLKVLPGESSKFEPQGDNEAKGYATYASSNLMPGASWLQYSLYVMEVHLECLTLAFEQLAEDRNLFISEECKKAESQYEDLISKGFQISVSHF